MRRPVSLSVIAVLLLIPLVGAAADLSVMIDGRTVVFSDVPDNAWFTTYVQQAAEAGIVSGYRDAEGNLTGKFGPGDPVTIAQALKIAVEGAGYIPAPYGCTGGIPCHWALGYLLVARDQQFSFFQNGIFFEDYSNMDKTATRAQVAQIIVDAFMPLWKADTIVPERYSDVDLNNPQHYESAINSLTQDGIVSGDGECSIQTSDWCPQTTFRPLDRINRAETVKIVMNARAKYGEPGRAAQPEGMDLSEPVRVHYSNTGFSPSPLTVKQGKTVIFINESSRDMWVASDPHPVHSDLPDFAQRNVIKPGETSPPDSSFSYTFQEKGSWGYHNHLSPSHRGTIIVEPGRQTEPSQGSSTNVLQALEQHLAGWTEQWQALIPNFRLSNLLKVREGPIRPDTVGSLDLYGPTMEYLQNRQNYPLLYQSPDGSKSVYVSPSGGMLSPEARQFFVVGFDADTSVAIIDTTNNSYMRVLFCGTPCHYDGATWLDNQVFAVTGSTEYHPPNEADRCSVNNPTCTVVPTVHVFDLSRGTYTVYHGPEVDRAVFDTRSQ